MTPESLFINGTVGVGKSTVASHLSHLLRSSGRPHAVIDLDDVRRSWPSPENDPFNQELELRNLTALAANFSEAGAELFIIAGVIEEATEVRRYREALGTADCSFLDLQLRHQSYGADCTPGMRMAVMVSPGT
jgi:adenylylsulfate kinase